MTTPKLTRTMASLAERGRQLRTSIAERSKRALRLTKIQMRRSRRSLGKQAHRLRVAVIMRLFRAQQRGERIGQRTILYASRWSATLLSVLLAGLFIAVADASSTLKASEVSLTCAQVIGAALALILSLSIIPAQRAAEAFSPAVLKLYAKDHWLIGAFLILALTTAGSVLLGANFLPGMGRISIGIQFLLLGVSFDALRVFHGRTLDLLNPQTAIDLIVRECTKLLNRVTRAVDKLTRLQALASGSTPTDASRAVYFSASQVSGALRVWIAQLEEIAHKLIARRDTSGANAIVLAVSRIGIQYSETRRSSLILLPNWSNFFAGGVSDISDVLNPIYESIRVICDDAAKASNELVVRQGIQALAAMTTHAMTMVHSANHSKQAPLAFSGCFWLGQCSTIAVKADMGDAVLAAVAGFQDALLAQKSDVSTTELEAQALESLLALAAASYAKPDAAVGAFPAVRAMLLAARHDIELHGYQDISVLEKVLGYLRLLAPLEITMEKAGRRVLQVFPPYDLSFEASVPALLEMVAHRVAVDADQPWNNPFSEFLKAAEDVRHHYRELSQTSFENTLAQKWVVNSLVAAARVHWSLVVQPPAGTEAHIDDVDETLRHLISWLPEFFPAESQPHRHQMVEAADSLACLGMSMLEHDRAASAQGCASAIAGLVSNSAAQHPEAYTLADLHQRLEVLARAADALGKPQEAVSIRAMIQRPATINEADWPLYLEAQNNRFRHLDRNLREPSNRYSAIRDDPIADLQEILSRGAT